MIKATADLQVLIAGLSLKNPVMTASGTFGYASEFVDLVDLNRLGAIVVKGLSLEPSDRQPAAPDCGNAVRDAECHWP